MLKCGVTLSNKSEILEQVVKLREPGTEKFRPDSLLVCYTIFRTDSKLQPVRGEGEKMRLNHASARLEGCAGLHQPFNLPESALQLFNLLQNQARVEARALA